VSLGWDRNGDPTSVANALQDRNLVVSACFSHSFSIHISKLQDVAPSFFLAMGLSNLRFSATVALLENWDRASSNSFLF